MARSRQAKTATGMLALIRNRESRRSRTIRQFLAFGVVSFGAVGLTGILSKLRGDVRRPFLGTVPEKPSDYFRPFVGDAPPLLAVAGAVVIGGGSLGFLRSRDWFGILPERGMGLGVAVATAAGTLLSIEAIVAEAGRIVSFDDDINVPLPWSLLYYPVVAYVVEIVFHTLPLALLLGTLGSRIDARHTDRLVRACVAIVALIEPVLQLSQFDRDSTDSRTRLWLSVQVLATNLVQLSLFRRYGFASMLSLRLTYYFWWHVLWGHLRLQRLFRSTTVHTNELTPLSPLMGPRHAPT